MTQILRRMAVSGLGLALTGSVAFAGTAHADMHEAEAGGVTVGGVVEVIGGSSDDSDYDGLSRGLFSRINLDYSKTLDNGLEVGAKIQYQVNQRGTGGSDPENVTAYAPDVLFVTVGGGFGTVSVGAHAAASCAMLPRPIAFVPGGTNATWYTLFTAFETGNSVFTESNYCGTSEAISYATPTISGFSAMVTYAPNMGVNQGTTIKNATDGGENKPDYVAAAAKFAADMGGVDLALGASWQTSDDDTMGNEIDSQSVAGTVGLGGGTLGAAWFDNGDGDYSGYTVAAKYALGSITPAIAYSAQEMDGTKEEETALVVGANYAVGGGLSVFVEYMSLEEEGTGADGMGKDDDSLVMGGIIVSF